ncbi:MAG: chromate transporter [Hungatella sp.]|nr:chromate transporter [Hungatella sp.]
MVLLELFLSFMKIGFFSFGGLTMIPVINDEVLVHGWMTADEVMDIVAVAEMTPGSLGINCATFVGLRTAGVIGAFCATLGVMMPSLTLCMAAAHFLIKLKGSTIMESAMSGVRPVSMGMLLAVVVTLSQTTFWVEGAALAFESIRWNLVVIAAICGIFMFRFRLTIPKTILLAAVLGLFMG